MSIVSWKVWNTEVVSGSSKESNFYFLWGNIQGAYFTGTSNDMMEHYLFWNFSFHLRLHCLLLKMYIRSEDQKHTVIKHSFSAILILSVLKLILMQISLSTNLSHRTFNTVYVLFFFIQPKMLYVCEKDTESPTETTDVIICFIFGVSSPEKSKPKCQT